MQTFDVIVVGAGIVGAALALSLEQANVAVAVIEPHPPGLWGNDAPWDNRVYTVSPGNAQWLEELAAWQRIPPDRLTRVETMDVHGDRQSGRLEFSAYEAGMRELAWVAEARELQGALWSALEQAAHVTPLPGSRCANLAWAPEGAHLALDDGTELTARLVVGADGADSWVRQQTDIEVMTHDYGQLGVVANFETQLSHHGVAYQWFTGDGVLALLPLPQNRVSMVWSAREALAHELLAATPERLCEVVESASAGALGSLRVITRAAAFALKRQQLTRLVAPRAALVGDAAHNIHPLAGQGVNLGLRDARDLCSVLAGRGARRDCGDYALLRRYERARREDIAALELSTDGLEKLFNIPTVWMARLRNFGLALVDAQGPLKTALVRRAVA